ncbi:TPA: sulfatase, partial [bacterium]|nr:sulfatase [bacterium]
MNIILIALDTLSAKHLGCYGYRRNTSPNIDNFADSATLFENCFASGIPTQPSFTTTFSGREPLDHGIVAHQGTFDVRSDVVFLPEILNENGYKTACISDLTVIKSWFKRGWKEIIPPIETGPYNHVLNADGINKVAIPWLKQQNQKFFLFLHYWDVHIPYFAPIEYRNKFYSGNPGDPNLKSMLPFDDNPFSEWWLKARDENGSMTGWIDRLAKEAGVEKITDAEYIVAQYDTEIFYLDEKIKELFDTIQETGLEDNTLIVIMSDHGEEMYEHGIFFDHHGLYDSNLHTPLIVKIPCQTKGQRIPYHVRHQDIAVTILDFSGIDV